MKISIIITALALISSAALAKSNVYKYEIEPSLFIRESCVSPEDKDTKLSQVRISINQKEISDTSADVVHGEAKITACITGGKIVKKSMELPLPKELLTGETVRTGTRDLKVGKFRSMDIKKSNSKNTYEITYYTNQGAWDVINPVIIEAKSKTDKAPKSLKLKVVKQKMWLKATLRLIETE